MKKKTTNWFKIAIENLPIKKIMILTTLALLFPLVSFSQTVYTFTTAGATGRFGPTQGQCDTAYGVGVVTVNTQGIQEWTVPITGKYSLQALGAAGGNTTSYGASGGLGASMSGEFNLTAGQVLKIVVGQQGGSGPGAGSGGGGSFIVSNTNTPLLIAGGGGGKEYGGLTQSYQHGSILQNGQNTAYVSGGTNGSGGSGDSNNGASGGGGFSGNGTNGMYGTFGFAFLNGAVGGDFTWGYSVCVGGFGGGGGTHGNSGGGGGGGGYSGGAGGEHDEVGGNGGGGGSYNSGTNQTNVAGANSGNGSVVITSLYSASISQSSNVVCDTDSTGELSVAVDGGTGPYAYTWVPNVSASSIASGLTVGTYEVTVNDANSLTTTSSFTITSSDNVPPTIATLSVIDVNADAGVCTYASVQLTAPTAADNCSVVSVVASPASLVLGANTVTWTVTDGAGLTATSTQIVTVQDVTDPVITCPENISVNNDSGVCTANVSIPSGGNTPPKILLVAADDQTWVADVQSKLIATGAFNSVDLFDATSGTPSTALLANYKAVLVWTDENANNPTLLGDNLVSYIDNGGGVVSMVFDIASVPISGAFNTDAYRCLVPDSQTQGSMESLGTIYDAAHPIMSGVVSFNGGTSSYRSDSNTLATGAIKVADWTDGLPLVVVKENVGLSNVRRADLNFFPPSTNSRGDFWDAATDGDLLMKNALLWVAGSTSSAGGAVASDSCSNTITITNNITGTNDASGVYPVGTTNVVWTATDASGNSSSCTQTVTVMDAENPTIATLSGISVNADAGVCTYASAQLTAPTAADNCSVIMVVASPASLVSGANTVTWTVTDGAGLIATSTQTVTVVDAENPTIATLSAMNANADAGVCTYASSQLTAPTAADNCNVVSVVAIPASLVLGANTVTWTVTDGAGLTATSTQIVTVVDAENPTIAALSAMSVNADAGVCTYASLQLTAPTAADNCNVVSVVATPTRLVSGANTVTWTVTDGAGLTATSTQTVTVVDIQKPTVITKNIPVSLDAFGNVSITVAQINNGSTDNCGINLVELDKMSFTCANVGANTVTLKVIDNNGNVATKTAIVTVEDKIAPVVIVKNITVQLDASSNILIAAADVNNGSTDNCGISLLELDKALFSCADVGENVVTLKVTDNSGNVATRTAIVTIVNSQPNLIRKHFDDVIFFDNSSKAFVAYSWYKNGVLVSGQTAQYFKDSGVLNGAYYAKATKIDGTVVTTCPLMFSASIVDEYLKIAPNPVKSNASYQILTNVDSAKLQNARITVFTILGVLVNDKMVDGKTTDMIAPNTEGIYVVRMTLASGKYFTKNLLVKN
ncbi:HYR domain-containing protein [Flavobacterium yafengii]|uniref:HYR domain-containing protein n=1 Tax=Flavobacterium yafengii TaxID=3041253 RepID=UPI0024A8C726|nr:HYR domain-containing protein [Flavobacterium yafengii]MDI6047746.1 HYR domain-containing protein [Flavobacterium yafengii]